MDLRPKLANDFIEAIANDNAIPHLKRTDKDRLIRKILDAFVSHSIPTTAPNPTDNYIDKYPKVKTLIKLAKTEARRRWPEAHFSLDLNSDPESCHICQEGQTLTLNIHIPNLDFYDQEGNFSNLSPHWIAEQQWLQWTTTSTEYRQAEAHIGFLQFRAAIAID